MLNTNLAEIKDKISRLHEDDEKQLEVIFSDSHRLIVEAPAGYGKTVTMISRIAYLFAIGGIPNPKRILGLTFSVNAALKIKREVAKKLPELLGIQNNIVSLNKKVTVTNYHGFCKNILRKYGYLISTDLREDINLFMGINEDAINKIEGLKGALSLTELQKLVNVKKSIDNACLTSKQLIREYNDIIIEKLLPLRYITHNAIILFVLEIFERFSEVRKFYQSYYSLIIVDEFQDTNCIAWNLLESIIGDNTKLVFLGDSLQRIYGFIGALPNIMDLAAKKYRMIQITLAKNYRFRNNHEMLKLDHNIRANAEANFTPIINETAQLPCFFGPTQQIEASMVTDRVQSIINDSDNKVAILFRGRGKNVEGFEEELSKHRVPYFW